MLLESLVENLRLIPRVRSAGALHWLFTLLNRIKCMDAALTGHACVEILGEVAKHYHGRINPLHSLLKSRWVYFWIVWGLTRWISHTVFLPFVSAAPWIFWHILTSCVNSTSGMHLTDFEMVQKSWECKPGIVHSILKQFLPLSMSVFSLNCRFGLYGAPLDPVLFAIDPPQLAKVGANSNPTSYASVTTYSSMTGFSTHSTTGMGSSSANTGNTGKFTHVTVAQMKEIIHAPRGDWPGGGVSRLLYRQFHYFVFSSQTCCLFYTGVTAGQDEPDLRDLMLLGSTEATGSSSKSSGSSNNSAVQHVCGLLEVEPLHFVCHATSDGTRMERMDTGIVRPILRGLTVCVK